MTECHSVPSEGSTPQCDAGHRNGVPEGVCTNSLPFLSRFAVFSSLLLGIIKINFASALASCVGSVFTFPFFHTPLPCGHLPCLRGGKWMGVCQFLRFPFPVLIGLSGERVSDLVFRFPFSPFRFTYVRSRQEALPTLRCSISVWARLRCAYEASFLPLQQGRVPFLSPECVPEWSWPSCS